MTLKPSGTTLVWIKSSYSGSNNNDCIEVAWQKSSYSHQSDGNECVEVATTPDTIRIRDSKNPHGPQLRIRPTTWADFLTYATEAR
ncbi:DUF397 domain-containing protein [Streptomyces sioyaensis]|uniref:DUF397 domain-containing protein n=1 Tax=Streptomyces sioyaensis TaxID=67364 RepID=UPI001F25EA50|nr:DUF397 domain-containing protein [Streptomyces sioyaensis]MCF3177057.1 DUF397 domain-containing protein [Streptomyces sioyaensis]